MTAQSQSKQLLGMARDTANVAVRVVMVVLWLAAGAFVFIPTSKMVFDHWAGTPLWQGMKEGWAPATPSVKAKAVK